MSVSLFDANFYRAANPDKVGLNNDQARSDFLNSGIQKGLKFSPFADLNFYRSSNSDLANLNNRQLFDHLENYGVAQGRKFSQFFDLGYYKANNSDLGGLGNEQLLEHFRNTGLEAGKRFSAAFDINYYRDRQSDLAEAGEGRRQAYEHFQLYGVQQGLLSSANFNAKVYLANNPSVAAEFDFAKAYDDYVLRGMQAGRPGSDYAGNTLSTARNLGTLSNSQTLTDFVGSTDTNDYYKFNWNTAGNISLFVNGLAAGTSLQLRDSNGTVLKSSTNSGTTTNGTTSGSITTNLGVGTYYVRVAPATITGNQVYANKDFYNLTLQPHQAPNTVTVAASNTALKTGANYVATGVKDQEVIERAIAAVGGKGGGTVVLLDGTFNISDNIDITYDNVTLSGVGWATKLRITNNTVLEDAGLLRSAFHTEAENIAKPDFFRQHFKSMVLDGNRTNQTSTTNSYANFGTYRDSSFEDVRAYNFGAYGFDPHENSAVGLPTVRLKMKYNLADRNGKDGITIDNCEDSFFIGNISDANTRHGFNIVTASRNNTFLSNVATNNGSNGFTIQSGSELERTSDGNKLIGNVSKFNQGAGIYNYLGKNVEIIDNVSADNGQHGIRLRSASSNSIRGNRLFNNSQLEADKYNEIYIDNDGSTFSTNNFVAFNRIVNNKTIRARYAITERSTGENFNILAGNTIEGTTRRIRLLGANSQLLF